MEQWSRVWLGAVGGVLLSGCATMMSGTTQKVQIVSDPPGAVAKIGVREVTTPATVELPRKSTYRVVIEKDGYEPAQREISRRINNQVYWNAIAGGIFLGMLVDWSSGAAYELVPSVIQVSLVPKGDDSIAAPAESMREAP